VAAAVSVNAEAAPSTEGRLLRVDSHSPDFPCGSNSAMLEPCEAGMVRRRLSAPVFKRVSWEDDDQGMDEKKHKSVNLRDQLNLVTSDLATTQADVQHLKMEHAKVDVMMKWMQTKMAEIATICSQTDDAQNQWKQEICKVKQTQEQDVLMNIADVNELKVKVAAWEKVEVKTSNALRDALWALEQLRADNDSVKKKLEAVTAAVNLDVRAVEIDLKQSLQNQVATMRREVRNEMLGISAQFKPEASDLELERGAKRMDRSPSLFELQNKPVISVQSDEVTEQEEDPDDIDNVAQKVAKMGRELEAELAQRSAKLNASEWSIRGKSFE